VHPGGPGALHHGRPWSVAWATAHGHQSYVSRELDMYLKSLDRKKRESTEGSARVTPLTVVMARWANSLSVGILEGHCFEEGPCSKRK